MQQVQVGLVAYSGFPVRSLTKQLNGDGGEWITAYRVEQKKRFKTILSSATPKATSNSSRIFRPPTNTREVSSSIVSKRHTLDKSFLLSYCYVDEPSDLCVTNISGAGLENYVSEDLTQFHNVVHVNASDNKLTVDAFTSFPALEELELALNGVVDIQLNHGDFLCLHHLNLSYNTLSGLALMELGTLPSLRELHLTGNNIVALPVEMTRPFPNSGGCLEVRFPALERLWLDDNKLSDQTTFATLAGLRKLRYLNLDNNEIYAIPQLKLLGASPIKQQTHTTSTAMSTSSLNHHIKQPTHDSNTILSEPTTATTIDSIQEYLLPDSLNLTPLPTVHVPPNTAERTMNSSKSETIMTQCVHTAIDGTDASRSKSTDEINMTKSPLTDPSLDLPPASIPTVYTGQDQTERPLPKVPEKVKTDPNPSQPELSVCEQQKKEPHPPQIDGRISGDGKRTLRTDLEVDVDVVENRENPFQEGLEAGQIEASSQQPSSGEGQSSLNGVAKLQEPTEFMRTTEHKESVNMTSMSPFPELETLSLVNNLLLTSEGVIACESWPALKDLILYGNPFTQSCKGMPSLLQAHLVNQCGIRVVRKKPGSTKKHYIVNGAKEFKKVSTNLPAPIPKCPLPAIEYSPTTEINMIGYTPSHSHTDTHSSPRSFSPDSTDSMGSLLNESGDSDQQGVFMTQVDGEEPPDLSPNPLPVPGIRTAWSSKDDYEARRKELKNKFRDVPDRYKGYEVLLDTYDDPQTKIPTDIHGCVRALQYSLKHPLVLGDRGTKISSTASSPSSTVSSLTGNYLKKKTPPVAVLPPVQTHSKVKEIQSVLDDIRTDCTALETNLSLALKPKTPPARKSISQLQKESKQLLAEMQACYDKVRESSLKSVRSLSSEMNKVNTSSIPSSTPKTPRVRFSRNEQVNSSPNRTNRTSRTSSRGSSGH